MISISKRRSAIIIGVLFLVALLFDLLATSILDPVLEGPNYLENAYPARTAVIIGNGLHLICAIAIIFIPIVLFSVVGRSQKQLAVGYIVFRALEGILFIYIAVQSLRFIGISESYLSIDPAPQ